MAILSTYPDLQVNVYVDGKSLQEYDDDEHPPTSDTVTKYMEAVSGAAFEIQYVHSQRTPSKLGVGFILYVDGKAVGNMVFNSIESCFINARIQGCRSRINGR